MIFSAFKVLFKKKHLTSSHMEPFDIRDYVVAKIISNINSLFMLELSDPLPLIHQNINEKK